MAARETPGEGGPTGGEDGAGAAAAGEAPVEALRRRALEAHVAGDAARAVRLQAEAINRRAVPPAAAVDDLKRLALYFFAAGDLAKAARCLETVLPHAPGDPEVAGNLGTVYLRMRRHGDAVPLLERIAATHPDEAGTFDALAHGYGALGRRGEARSAGIRALTLKDAEDKHAEPFALPEGPAPAFRPDRPAENVIAFSLFGDAPRYLEGA